MATSTRARRDMFTVLGKIALVDGKKKLALNSPGHYQCELNDLPEGKKVAITIASDESARSRGQLAYFMVLAGYIARQTGYTTKEVYPLLIEDVFEPEERKWRGKLRKIRRSVSELAKMPTADMSLLIDHAREVCDELEIHVPTAEELGYISN